MEWLENCAPLAYNKPMVREILNQYIYLIKKLTNQTTSEEMSDEIIKIINKNFKASEEIFKNFEKALMYKQIEFLEKIKRKLNSNIENNSSIIQNVIVENIENSNRLKLVLAKGFFISFHFKSNLGLLLVGNSIEKFGLNDDRFFKDFEEFKKRDWNKNLPSHYIFWKHKWGEFGSTVKLMESENAENLEDENSIVIELIQIAYNFNRQYII